MEGNVAIIGGNSLLGQHLFSKLLGRAKKISVWTSCEEFIHNLESNQNKPTDGVYYFTGIQNLQQALVNCDTAFNLHEFHDFSATPDKKRLYDNNVKFVEELVKRCIEAKVPRVIHLSSIYMQCSGWWPNVGQREQDPARYVHDNPFPAYFNSKYKSELIFQQNDQIDSIIARVGPLYGEGDKQSIICDLIKMHDTLGFMPIIGDMGGAVQLTYAGNAADALITCAETLVLQPKLKHEAINIVDSTPVQPLYEGVARDCFEATGRRLSRIYLPFWLFFPLYCMLSMLSYGISWIPFISNPLRALPSTAFIYIMFRQWTCLADYRLSLLTPFREQEPADTNLGHALTYYERDFQVEDVKQYSWLSFNEQLL